MKLFGFLFKRKSTTTILAIAVILVGGTKYYLSNSQILVSFQSTHNNKKDAAVLGTNTQASLADNLFQVNIPAEFTASVTFDSGLNLKKGITVLGDSIFNGNTTFNKGITTNGQNILAGAGSVIASTVTAPNLLYSVKGGSGISISGGQTPTITNNGVLSFQGSTGAINLTAGNGISITGTTITNADNGSSQNIFKNIAVLNQPTITANSNNDTLNLVAGSGIGLVTDSVNKDVTITNTLGGAVVSGTQNYLSKFATSSTLGDSLLYDSGTGLGIGTTIPIGLFDIDGQVPGQSLLNLNYTGTDQNILTASRSGITKFVLDYNGNITTGTWNGSTISPTYGGTGLSTYTTGNLLYASASNTLSSLPIGTSGYVLTASGGLPQWEPSTGGGGGCAQCVENFPISSLTNIVAASASAVVPLTLRGTSDNSADILDVENNTGSSKYFVINSSGNVTTGTWNGSTISPTYGGTGLSTYTTGNLLYASASNTLSSLPIGTSGYVLTASGGLPQWEPSTGGVSYFQRNNGSISPINITDDLLVGAVATSSALESLSGTLATTGNQAVINANGLTSGNGLNLLSTSANLTSGSLFNINLTGNSAFSSGISSIAWNPTSPTTATGDLLDLNVGSNGTLNNIFNVENGGSSVFSVSQDQITAGIPMHINAPGDFSLAYDLSFTNPVLSSIKSNSSLNIYAGLPYNSSYLTLGTYNAGVVVIDSQSLSVNNAASISGQLSVGTTSQDSANTGNLYVTNSQVYGKALAIFNQTENADILSASNSGASVFTVGNNGNLSVNALSGFSGNLLSLSTNGTSEFAINQAGNLSLGGNISSNVVPNANNSYNLGSNANYWNNGYITTLYTSSIIGASNGISGYIQRNNGAISPTNITDDLLLGATSTASAITKFSGSNSGVSYINSGNFGLGTVNPKSLLEVKGGGSGGNALGIFNQIGSSNNDILTASAGGTMRFTIGYNGNVTQNNIDTTNTAFNLTANSLTTGTAMSLNSTSANLTSGGLLNVNFTGNSTFNSGISSIAWNPTSATTATGDLLDLNVGSNGTLNNILNVENGGSSVFSVSQTQITANEPFALNSPGNLSIGYDINLTNPISSAITSAAPINMYAGDVFNSSSLTLGTYNAGNVVIDSQALVTLQSATVSGQLVVGNTYSPAMTMGEAYITNSQTFGKSLLTLNQTENSDIFTASNSGTPVFTIANNGNTTIENAGLCVTNHAGVCSVSMSPGNIYADAALNTGADVAEDYVSSQNLVPGDVVVMANDGNSDAVVKATSPNQGGLLGVVSTNPGVTVNSGARTDSSHQYLYQIALVGRVPVEVSSVNGTIKVGDPLTSSSIPGVVVKSTTPGLIVGRALQDYNDANPNDTGSILIYTNVSWFDPTISIASDGNITQSQSNSSTTQIASDGSLNTQNTPAIVGSNSSNLSLTVLQSQFNTLQSQVASISAEVNSLTASQANLQTQINSQALPQFSATISAQLDNNTLTVDSMGNATISGKLTVLGRTTLGDVGITGNINAGLLTINGLNGSLDSIGQPLMLQSMATAGINIENGAITIDNTGNMVINAQITAQKLNIDTSNTQMASLGKAIINKGESSVTVTTDALTANSEIFATPVDMPIPVSTSKTGINTFVIRLSTVQNANITVNWWVVN